MFRFSTCLIMWGCLCHVTFEQLKLKQVQEKSGLEKEKKNEKKNLLRILREKITELS